ncbi:MAG TPA: Rieske (2Fe-2S) protein, partial [Acetobacteraceae bacterium]|nr:Rieske (2Fe-2S) protein [Acetobacteraceae bacterium]
MNHTPRLSAALIRDDFVPKDGFISTEFMRLENDRMWPKVWQIACREEEIPNPGDYVTYEIAGEPLIVVRTTPDKIKCFYNVCQHRGRVIKEQPFGSTKFLYCRYHGWRWTLDGAVSR